MNLRTKKTKTTRRIICILLILCIILISTLTITNSKNYYWNNSPNSSVQMSNRAIKLISKDKQKYQDLSIEENDRIENSKELREAYKPLINEANSLVINYFSELYNVDLTDIINELNVYEADLSDSIAGCYCGLQKLYLSSYFLIDEPSSDIHFSDDLLESEIYIHELIHYLGIYTGEDMHMIFLVEGLTEYLTDSILNYGNYSSSGNSTYADYVKVAEQMLSVDPQLIIDTILNRDNCNSYLINRINSVSYEGLAEKLGDSMWIIDSHPQYAQYYALEFVKCFETYNVDEIESNFILSPTRFYLFSMFA